MNDSATIIDFPISIQPVGENLISVSFKNSQRATLKMGDQMSIHFLEELVRQTESQVVSYVRCDSQRRIQDVRYPLPHFVSSVSSDKGGTILVRLYTSPTPVYIKPNSALVPVSDFLKEAAGKNSEVLITQDCEGQLLDARVAEGHRTGKKIGECFAACDTSVSILDDARMNELWKIVVDASCSNTATAQCIPFNWTRWGCEARAHEVCRTLCTNGETSEKIWVKDAHYPGGEWDYHVAAIVSTSQTRFVFDPSIVPNSPASINSWKLAMRLPTSSPHGITPSGTYRSYDHCGSYTNDNDCATTMETLAAARSCLRRRNYSS